MPQQKPNSQKPKLLYYIHHHGNGHIARAKKLVPLAEKYADVSLLIGHHAFKAVVAEALSNREIFTLPAKCQGNTAKARSFDAAFEGVPLSPSSCHRAYYFYQLVNETLFTGFISDVSAELTIYARGAGLPVLMQRHTGDISGDPTQVFAYHCAQALYAPYPSQFEAPDFAFLNKTTFLGCIAASTNNSPVIKKGITVIHNDAQVINAICEALLPYEMPISVVGGDKTQLRYLNQVTHNEQVDSIIAHAQTDIVFCSGGNNTLCELLSVGKKLIVVPASRPYGEQNAKAKRLSEIGAAVCLEKDELHEKINILHAVDHAKSLNADTLATIKNETVSALWQRNFEALVKEHLL